MKLYISPAACSLSCHIALEETGLPFETFLAKFGDRAQFAEIEKLNPQGAVPILVLNDGTVLTQNIGILTYIAEKAPQAKLLPPVGTLERAQTYQWASWVGADLHKAFGILFSDDITDQVRAEATARVKDLLIEADRHIQGKEFVAANQFTIADCYLFTIYGWCRWVELPTDPYKNLNAYAAKIAGRPAVQRAMKREGLVK